MQEESGDVGTEASLGEGRIKWTQCIRNREDNYVALFHSKPLGSLNLIDKSRTPSGLILETYAKESNPKPFSPKIIMCVKCLSCVSFRRHYVDYMTEKYSNVYIRRSVSWFLLYLIFAAVSIRLGYAKDKNFLLCFLSKSAPDIQIDIFRIG